MDFQVSPVTPNDLAASLSCAHLTRPQEIIMFLQRLPTQTWQDHDVELLLSEAYVLKNVWQGAENHFTTSSSSSQNGSGPGGGGFGMLGR